LFRYYGFCYHLSYEIYFCSVRNFILTSIRHLSSYFLKEIIYYFIRNLYLHFQLPMLLYERTRCETLHKEIQLSDSCDPQTCLISYENDTTFGQGNQISLQPAYLLLFKFGCKIGFWTEATGSASNRQICCLSCLDARWDFGQRQPDLPPTGKSAAFHVWMQDGILDRGN